MEILLLFARLTLTAVFGVAGIAKWFDRTGAEKAIVNFGVPEAFAKPLAVILPILEIATAVLLLPLATAWFGALLSLVLLLAFIGGIIYNLRLGNAPDCHCFGQIHSEPIGWSVLIRNLILLIVAGFVVIAARQNAGASAFGWFRELSTGEQMQLFFNLVFVGVLWLIAFNLQKVLRNQIVLQRQIEALELTTNESEAKKRAVERKDLSAPSLGLPVGAVAPDFGAADLNGRQATLEHLMMLGKPILLFFVSPSCNPCQALLPAIEGLQRELNDKLTIVYASSGTIPENKEKFGEAKNAETVLLQKNHEIARLFRSDWTPGAVLINADGTIGSALATGDREILDLFDRLKNVLPNLAVQNDDDKMFFLPKERLNSAAPRPGQTVPPFVLPSLDGRQISSADLRGTKTLLLFWRATCPFCQNMIDDLKNWEQKPKREFELVVVAAKEPEIEIAREFQSTVLIETNLEVQRLFDYDATPGGLLINEEGKIVSDLATGADDVFALVGYYERKN